METSFVVLGSSFTAVRRFSLRHMLCHEYCMLPCSLGITQVGYNFLCRLLTGYRLSVPQWRFLEWTSIVNFVTDGKDSRCVHYTARSCGLTIVFPPNNCANHVRLLYCSSNYTIYIKHYMLEISPHCDLCLLTYSMVQSPSWEANWFAASQEIPRISRNPKVHYRIHKRPPPVSILDQPNPVHIPTSHLLEIHPNIIHPSMPRSPSLRFPNQDPIHPSPHPYAPHAQPISFFSILSPAQYWVRSTNYYYYYYYYYYLKLRCTTFLRKKHRH